jgi:DUF4097 and DUF4098 domain-containing protein YvlB
VRVFALALARSVAGRTAHSGGWSETYSTRTSMEIPISTTERSTVRVHIPPTFPTHLRVTSSAHGTISLSTSSSSSSSSSLSPSSTTSSPSALAVSSDGVTVTISQIAPLPNTDDTLHVTMPMSHASLEASTGRGSVHVESIKEGDLHLTSTVGDLHVEKMQGMRATLVTSGGTVSGAITAAHLVIAAAATRLKRLAGRHVHVATTSTSTITSPTSPTPAGQMTARYVYAEESCVIAAGHGGVAIQTLQTPGRAYVTSNSSDNEVSGGTSGVVRLSGIQGNVDVETSGGTSVVLALTREAQDVTVATGGGPVTCSVAHDAARMGLRLRDSDTSTMVSSRSRCPNASLSTITRTSETTMEVSRRALDLVFGPDPSPPSAGRDGRENGGRGDHADQQHDPWEWLTPRVAEGGGRKAQIVAASSSSTTTSPTSGEHRASLSSELGLLENVPFASRHVRMADFPGRTGDPLRGPRLTIDTQGRGRVELGVQSWIEGFTSFDPTASR